jgi:hypothetical protein
MGVKDLDSIAQHGAACCLTRWSRTSKTSERHLVVLPGNALSCLGWTAKEIS